MHIITFDFVCLFLVYYFLCLFVCLFLVYYFLCLFVSCLQFWTPIGLFCNPGNLAFFLDVCRFTLLNLFVHSPVDTGRKLNVHKTSRRRTGRLLNVLCTFNLRLLSTRSYVLLLIYLFSVLFRQLQNCVYFLLTQVQERKHNLINRQTEV